MGTVILNGVNLTAELERLRRENSQLRRTVAMALEHADHQRGEIEGLRRFALAAAERIADQGELLTRKAMRV